MKLYVTESYSPESLAWLKAKGAFEFLSDGERHHAEALLIRSHTKITKSFLKEFGNLRFIATATSGFDHLNWQLCQEKGIITTYCPEANAQSAAEHTLFLILSLLKNANQQYRSIRGGLWKEGLERSYLLSEKTIGIVGLGRIGQKVARFSQAFGAQVVAHDPYQSDSVFESLQIERKGFTEVLKEADVLTLHVPLTSETHHMINGSTLSEMSDQAFLVNASRGAVIEESDLVSALRQKKIRGAALDVFSKEPLDPNGFLLKEPNLFLTPHTGAYSLIAWQNASLEAAQKLFAFANGQEVKDTLPLATPWFKKTINLA